MKYLVTFGPDTREVVAANPADAWAAFCGIMPAALKHPNLHVRVIEAVVVETGPTVEPAPAKEVPVEAPTETAVEPEPGPVSDPVMEPLIEESPIPEATETPATEDA